MIASEPPMLLLSSREERRLVDVVASMLSRLVFFLGITSRFGTIGAGSGTASAPGFPSTP